MQNENAMELVSQLSALLGVPVAHMAFRLNQVVNYGPDAVNLFYANVAESTEQLRQICRTMATEREDARLRDSQQNKAEIEMLEMWMDIPAHGREV